MRQPPLARLALTSRARLVALAATALLPRRLKRLVYQGLFGYLIHPTARIGLSLLNAGEVVIGANVVIGHGNAVHRVGRFRCGEGVRIGVLNVFRGGDEIDIGDNVDILRTNEFNSIPNPIVSGPTDPRLILGAGAFIAAGHKIDFTDRVTIGERAIIGGRYSSLWTHNRQATGPITIGERTYLGSDVKIAPGVTIACRCIVALGSVVAGNLDNESQLYAGVPARPVRPLKAEDLRRLEYPTRASAPI